MHAGLVRRNHRTQLGRGASGEEVADELSGRLVVAAAERKRVRFEAALKGDSGERRGRIARVAEVFWRNVDD